MHNGISDFGGQQTFAKCISLKEINIPPMVECLPMSCFEDCRALESVYISNRTHLTIEEDAFSGCYSLKKLHFRLEETSEIKIEDKAFPNSLFDNCVLCIPPGTRWAYRHHHILGKFKNIEIEKKD